MFDVVNVTPKMAIRNKHLHKKEIVQVALNEPK